jgi:hypothetical protein
MSWQPPGFDQAGWQPDGWQPGTDGLIEVPNVVGETQAAGTTTLEGDGFVVSVSTAYSDAVAIGLIISQSPNGGEFAPSGGTVNIVVSLGPQPDEDNSGGWGFLVQYELERRRKAERERRRRQLQEETEQIEAPVDKSIAQLLRKQERKDERRDEINRLKELVKSDRNQKAASAYNSKVGEAFRAAMERGTFSTLERLERELRRAQEEEEFMLVVARFLASLNG